MLPWSVTGGGRARAAVQVASRRRCSTVLAVLQAGVGVVLLVVVKSWRTYTVGGFECLLLYHTVGGSFFAQVKCEGRLHMV